MTKDKFKNALRFKLVQRSVRDQAQRAQQDAEEESGAGFSAATTSEARIFAPMNEAAREHLDDVLGALVSVQEKLATVVAHDRVVLQQGPTYDSKPAGEAAKYGIFFDDREYDYGRHLKVIGETPDAVFVHAAAPARAKETDLNRMFDDEELAGDGDLAGVEDDPAVKEALEALEDEAYEDENFEDDFVVKLDRDEDTAVLCPMDALPTRAELLRGFVKKTRPRDGTLSSDNDGEECALDEDDRTIDSSRRGTSYVASVAMTSIDSKFEQVLRFYEEDHDDISDVSLSFSDGGDDDDGGTEGSGTGPLNKQEVETALEEFLLNQRDYIRPSVEERKMSAIHLLNELRQELGPLPASVLDRELSETPDEDALEAALEINSDSESDHFDCQSILTTYTNTENLPGIVREPRQRPLSAPLAADCAQIRLSRRTGMPIMSKDAAVASPERDAGQATVASRGNKGEARKKEETAEEKRTRKTAIKEERRHNRVMKKELRVRFQLGNDTSESPALKDKPNKKPPRSILRS